LTATRTLPAIHTPEYTGADAEVVTYYHGKATISRPRPEDPIARDFDLVLCDHRHETTDAAEKCAGQLGQKTADARNAEDGPSFAAMPCHVEAYTSASSLASHGIWIKACRTHHTAATATRFGADAAMAVDWTCPWAGIAADEPAAGPADEPADGSAPPDMIP
jgi:hypothetical protein